MSRFIKSKFDLMLGINVVTCAAVGCQNVVTGIGPRGAHDAAIAAGWGAKQGTGPMCPTHLRAPRAAARKAVDILRSQIARGALAHSKEALEMLQEWEAA